MLETIPHEQALQSKARVVENVPLARDTYRLRVECPEMARVFLPGQFLMLRLHGPALLARPFALYDTYDADNQVAGVDIVYLVIGKVTRAMTDLATGDEVSLWGPLGNGFGAGPGAEEVVMVAGGIGQTPFLALAKHWLGTREYGSGGRVEDSPIKTARLFYGARNADWLAGVEDFQAADIQTEVSTDDGSRGHHGFVTDLVEAYLTQPDRPSCHIIGCGPEPMMVGLKDLAARYDTTCELSLENFMACGIGACFSCVTPVHDESMPEGIDYRRVCVEGPVFDACKLAW